MVFVLFPKCISAQEFKTNNNDRVKYSKHCFSFDMPSDLWKKRVKAFESKFNKM